MEDVIAETDADMICFTQPSSKPTTEHAEALLSKALQFNRVHDEYILLEISIEALPVYFRHNMHSYWGAKEERWSTRRSAPWDLLMALQHSTTNSETLCLTIRRIHVVEVKDEEAKMPTSSY